MIVNSSDRVERNFDTQRTDVAYRFADYALSLTYEELPGEVVHQAKRSLLDAIGCAIGACAAPGLPMVEAVVRELGGRSEATVIGSGTRTSAANATLVNSFLVRFLDFNDVGGGGHNSDVIPTLLAVGERVKASGRDVITAIVASYELGSTMRAGVTKWHGWLPDLRANFNVAPAVGRLLGMNVDQIVHAVGICVSGNTSLGILDAEGEEFAMRKNLRFGWGAHGAVLACLLAQRGGIGLSNAFERTNEVLLASGADFAALGDFSGWKIMNTRYKELAAAVNLHGLLQATLDIVKEQDLKPDDVAALRCWTRGGHRPVPSAKYPRTAESGDHSGYFLAAVAIRDREIGVDSIRPDNFTDPVILSLVDRITIEADPTMSASPAVKYVSKGGFEGRAEITTTDGRRFERHVEVPKGFWGSAPLSDQELELKFEAMASRYMSPASIRTLQNAIWNLEQCDDIAELMALTAFAAPSTSAVGAGGK